MTTDEKLESLIEKAGDLSDDALAELFQSIVEMRADHLGVYDPVDTEN